MPVFYVKPLQQQPVGKVNPNMLQRHLRMQLLGQHRHRPLGQPVLHAGHIHQHDSQHHQPDEDKQGIAENAKEAFQGSAVIK